jgi:hypothetical protein
MSKAASREFLEVVCFGFHFMKSDKTLKTLFQLHHLLIIKKNQNLENQLLFGEVFSKGRFSQFLLYPALQKCSMSLP